MTKLKSPVPFKRPKRGMLPGQSDSSLSDLSDAISIKVIDSPSGTIINRELLQIGNVGAGKFVEINLDGIKLHANSLSKIFINTDGDVFLGTDITDHSTTHMAIFANAQTYNGESMGVGDMLLGDNAAANIFWDASEGQMYLRNGTTITQVLDSDGDFFLGSDTSDPDLTFLAFFANNQTYNSEAVEVGDLLLGSNSVGRPNVFWDASAGQMKFRLGITDNIVMDSDGTIISQSNVTKVDIAADGDVFLGSDTSSPDTTALAIFAGNQTYNSEAVQANDILFGSNSAGQPNMFWDESAGQFLIRLGTDNTITMDSDGTILSAGNIQKIDLVQTGDLFVGRDTTNPDQTALSVFANNQTYNGEAVTTGDILIGSNSANQHNIFWDDSTGELLLRDGTNTLIELDGTTVVIGDVDTENIRISSSAVQIRDGATNHAQLTAGLLYLGDTSLENILISAASGLNFREATTSYAQLSDSALRLGQSGFENIRITGTELQIKDSSVVYTELAGGIMTLGRTSQEHMRLGGTSLQLKDGATIYTQLTSGELVLGSTSQDNIRISATELQIRHIGTVYTELSSGTLTLGLTSGDHVNISSGGIQIKDNTVIRGNWQSDGDIFIGSDISDPATTFLSAIANNQTYNGEAMTAGDILIGDNSAAKPNLFWDDSRGELQLRIGTTDNIVLDSDGTLITQGGETKIDNQVDGDLFIGRDTSSPDTTALAVFAVNQTYNSESMGAGDILLGSNSANQHNLYWDDSAGTFQLRDGTIVRLELDADTILLGDPSTENLRVSSSAVRIRDGATNYAELSGGILTLGATSGENILLSAASGINIREATTSHAQLTASTLRLGQTAQENILISSASGLNFREAGTSYAQLTGSALRLGQSGFENIRITGSELEIRDSSTVYTSLSAGSLIVGRSSAENIRLTSSEMQIRDSSTVYTELAGGIMTLGQTGQEHMRIGGTSLQLKDGATVYTSIGSGEVIIGTPGAENIRASTSEIQIRDTSVVYAELTGSILTLGLTASEHMRLSGSALQFRDGATVYTELSAGALTIGNTSQDHINISSSAFRIKDSGTVRGEWQTDGDIFIGDDISNPARTYLSIFATAQTYNSESVSAGDMLIGDNSPSKANIFWDKSAGTLKFRGGEDVEVYIDTSGALVAGAGDVTLDSSGIKIVSGTGTPNKIRYLSGSDVVHTSYTYIDGGAANTSFLTEGKDAGDPEAYFELRALTYDGAAHGGAGSVELLGSTSQDRIDIQAEIVSITKALKLIGMTTSQRNALTGPTAGMMVFNTTVSKFQGYDGSSWYDFH